MFFLSLTGRFDLVTTTIEEKTVLLYTQVVFIGNIQGGINKPGDVRSVIHLWLSDGTRTLDIGPISADDAGLSFSTLLHAKGELFALYSKEGERGGLGSLVFKPLTEQLRHIKTVLSKWKEVDDRVSKLCGSTTTAAMKDGAEGAGCVGPLPTVGLVGFLSNNANTTHWNDEYFGVNATVSTGMTKVENGFQLAGRGARIAWPVGRQGPNSVRSYVGEELTLVATVTIDKVPECATPLLGVSMHGFPAGKHLVLWYDERQHWKTRLGEEGNASEVAWEVGTAYRVALTVQEGGGSAYVDGQLVGSLEANRPSDSLRPPPPPPPPVPGKVGPRIRSELVSDIVFGGYDEDTEKDAESHVTVTNVLLYNRCFNGSEIEALMRRKESGAATEVEQLPPPTASPGTDQTGLMHGTTDSSAGEDAGPRDAPAPGPSNASAPHAKRVSEAAPKEVGGGDGSVRGHLSGALLPLLLLLGLWGFSALF
ncbi:trans-sialidase [Trypanosoma rangeli]|uniref:Trans-sialidase n=1 Tax=Trypanosoma rangeli TaxID=5698 RepID=A0A422MU34_TRYRA|nr:trans-sialidase [Trypanosoma rangeli]RNE96732.1 trans-sialidase [Trypanosoma rangeli]|eukprot:RNE96732.1 trans-sialidase [Trypanosoma rangeli]